MRGTGTFVERHVLSSWLIVAGVVLVALVANPPRRMLVDPAACPGLLELLATAASSLDQPIGTTLGWMNLAGVVLAAFAFARLGAGSHPLSLLAAGAAAAMTPVFGSVVLAPSGAAAFAAACIGFLATAPRPPGIARLTIVRALGRGLAMGLVAGIAPALTLPVVIAGALWAWLHSNGAGLPRRLATTAALVTGVAILGVRPGSDHAGALCLSFSSGGAALRAGMSAFGLVLGSMAPVAWGLAALGAFAARGEIRRREAWPAAALASASLVVFVSKDADPWRVLAPAIVAFWWLVAAGLRDAVTALGAGLTRRLAAAMLLVALPLLQYPRRPGGEVPHLAEPWGHEELTRADIAGLADVLPPGSALVPDDAATDLLMRGVARARRRSARPLTLVPREADDIRQALQTLRVFALPRAQRELQHQGFRIGGSVWPGVTGVSEILPGGRCRDVGAVWATVPRLAGTSAFALVAARELARGPIVVYLGSATPLDPQPIDWDGRARRGFHARTFVLDRADERDRLQVDRNTFAAPANDPVFSSADVARLEMWRVPGGSRVLPVALGGVLATVLARHRDAPDTGGIQICPSFPAEVDRVATGLRGPSSTRPR